MLGNGSAFGDDNAPRVETGGVLSREAREAAEGEVDVVGFTEAHAESVASAKTERRRIRIKSS